ncbi:MAG: DUF4253 domain-containing protein [Lachnospiraceae bacterium]
MSYQEKKSEQGNFAVNEMQGNNEITLEQANPTTKSIIAKLGYPYQIFSTTASYQDVMNAYNRALLQGQEEGFTPVLVSSDDVLEEYFGILEEDGYILEDILKKELKSGEELLKEYFEGYIEDTDNMEEFIGVFDGEPIVIGGYTAFQRFSSEKIIETILLKVPTTKPWELVAYVPFGGWNDCPNVEDMMAICKYWFEKYGAVPVTITHDVMEMHISTPIAEEDALQVAKEHFAFTPDRVSQCTRTGTLAEVAACIAASDIWYFWWD